jgi:hypothetical protein
MYKLQQRKRNCSNSVTFDITALQYPSIVTEFLTPMYEYLNKNSGMEKLHRPKNLGNKYRYRHKSNKFLTGTGKRGTNFFIFLFLWSLIVPVTSSKESGRD